MLPAARWFTKAVVAFDEEGNDEMAQEAQACLYWSKKRMDEKAIDAFLKGMPDKFRQIAEREVDANEAEAYMQRAVDFADKNPDEQLLIAIRYFEIADRFKGTDLATAAMEKSLAAMQQVQATPDFYPRKSELIASIVTPTLEEAWATYAEAVGKAKEEYVGALEKAQEYEQKKGNLEEAKQVAAEKEFILDGENTQSTAELNSSPGGRAQKSYMRAVERAAKDYVRAIEKEVTAETKKGNLDAASQLKMEIVMFENPGENKDALEKTVKNKTVSEKSSKTPEDDIKIISERHGDIESYNILKLVDTNKKIKGGNWMFEENSLLMEAGHRPKYPIPAFPTSDYSIELEVFFVNNPQVLFFLPVKDRWISFLWRPETDFAQVYMNNDSPIPEIYDKTYKPKTGRHGFGSLLKHSHPTYNLIFTVTFDEKTISVRIVQGDNCIYKWSGAIDNLSMNRDYKPPINSLCLSYWGDGFVRFDKMALSAKKGTVINPYTKKRIR